jgi:hypothetical protein
MPHAEHVRKALRLCARDRLAGRENRKEQGFVFLHRQRAARAREVHMGEGAVDSREKDVGGCECRSPMI